ncbi:MAG: hypothetical protein IPJ19_14035 [Planctomycetes bacterium]|nr:hypothetical protein [Planctomycetota bacterium]
MLEKPMSMSMRTASYESSIEAVPSVATSPTFSSTTATMLILTPPSGIIDICVSCSIVIR